MATTLLFDLDGTLTDSQEGIINCLLFALERLRCSSPPDRAVLAGVIGMPLKECFRTALATDDPDVLSEAVALYRSRFSTEGKYENSVYPGIPEALDFFRTRQARLFVATSKPEGFSREILGYFGLAPYFDGIYGSMLDGRLESKTDLIAHLIDRERLDPSDIVMIGDRKYDIAGGRANRTATAGVLWGYGSHEELRQAGADHLFHSPGELRTLL